MNSDIEKFIRIHYPGSMLRAWIAKQPDMATAWDACERGHWMLKMAHATKKIDKVTVAKIACAIARRALHAVPKHEKRPLAAIEAAEAWIKKPNKANALAAKKADQEAYAAFGTDSAVVNAAVISGMCAASAAGARCTKGALHAASAGAEAAVAVKDDGAGEMLEQAKLIRSMVANPFR